MLANIFYRKQPNFRDVSPDSLCASDFDYVCDFQPSILSQDGALGQVFCEFNAVDGTETCCKLRLRSMSVGDVVRTTDGVFLCASAGWEPVTGDAAAGFDARARAADFS